MQETRLSDETAVAPIEQALLLELERDRIAVGELLQADTAQVLTTVLVALASALQSDSENELRERVDEARPLVRDALERVQTLAAKIRSSLLKDFGLDAAVRNLVAGLAADEGPSLEVAMSAPDSQFSVLERSLVLRILDEALRNALEHGQAGRIRISSREVEGELQFEVQDDGRGFDSVNNRHGGGLALMRARASGLGGRIDIRSRSGSGTRVRLCLRKEGNQ